MLPQVNLYAEELTQTESLILLKPFSTVIRSFDFTKSHLEEIDQLRAKHWTETKALCFKVNIGTFYFYVMPTTEREGSQKESLK